MDDKSISDANILPDRHIKQSSKPVIIPYTSPDQSSPFVPSRCPITSLGHGFSLWVMYLPQEIHDRIIDFLADTPGIQKDTLGLRLVCRAWIPRLNFHVFRNLRMEVAHCPMLLSTVKSSKFSIGTSVRCLFVYGEDFQTARTVFPYQNDAVALQGYLRDLVEHLPYLETLNLADLFPDQMAWIPCFPSIKSLNLFDISMRPSQLLQIISTARSLENLRSSCCDLYAEGDGLPLVSPTSLLSLENLRSYETFLFANDDRVFLDSHLFPIKFEPKLPSLSRLSLGRVHPETMSIALHLMKAVSQSLRFLQLWFRRTYIQTENYQQLFDFSRFEMLEFIRFRCLGAPSILRFGELDVVLVALTSIPKTVTNLTISLFFYDDWEENGEFIKRVDSLLASKRGVIFVEIIPWRPEYQDKMREAFPRLSAKKKLGVVRKWSEATQIFPLREVQVQPPSL